MPTAWSAMERAVPAANALPGDFVSVSGSPDGTVMAVGMDGKAARKSGATWVLTPTPTTANLFRVAVRSATDAWATGGTGGPLLHFDGTSWSTVSAEPTMPTGDFQDVAVMPDGAAWIVSAGVLYRRAAGGM